MRKPFSPQEKQRIRRRHRGYAVLLAVVAVAVLVQPLALNWPLLTSVNSIIMAMVMMLFLTRTPPFAPTNAGFMPWARARSASK